MAKLWDFYDGEPFMENPHVAIIGNPGKGRKVNSKKGKTKMAFKTRRKHRRTRTSNARRHHRRARRNPITGAGLLFNPRRKNYGTRRGAARARRRRLGLRENPRRRHHYRRNPAILGVSLPPLNMIAWGAGGFIATPMLERTINSFLTSNTTTSTITSSALGRYAVKIGSALILTYLTKMVLGNKEAFPVAMGGALYVTVSAINEFAPQLTGSTTTATSAYRGGMINAYRGGMIATGVPTGMNGYTKGLGHALPGLARSLPGLAYGASALIPNANINYSGMTNPTAADPRFVNAAQISR